jgi:hypothetical protein
MSSRKKIIFEILAGPLDGHVITLENDTEWTRAVGSLLSFPWDDDLGQPQGRFLIEENQWMIEPFNSPHGTYIINREIKLSNKIGLQKGDLIKASATWIMIKDVD